jgi:GntR family transcriptional regulator
MFFSIDPDNGVAIYEQIVRQIKFAIAEGTLVPGQMLPSVRQLGQQLAINPNTINRAFQQLQQEQIISPLRGLGLTVERNAAAKCIEARQNLIAQRMRAVITEALHSGLSGRQIERLVKELLQELNGQVPTVASTEAES